MFTSERYISAGEKNIVLAGWSRFIRNGFREVDFSEALYKLLTLHCSFIAHTDRRRFYERFFADNAAALAVFMNQFGGTKVAAETLWVEWRSGTAHDLKEAMCEDATTLFPAFERVLAEYAREKYEEEKWHEARKQTAELPQQMQGSEAMSHMGIVFEIIFPFETYLNHLMVDDELRHRLTIEQEIIFASPDWPAPAAEAPSRNLNGRADEIAGVRHLSLFEQPEEKETVLPPIASGTADLMQQIAALSSPADDTTHHVSPVVIEGEKALYAEM